MSGKQLSFLNCDSRGTGRKERLGSVCTYLGHWGKHKNLQGFWSSFGRFSKFGYNSKPSELPALGIEKGSVPAGQILRAERLFLWFVPPDESKSLSAEPWRLRAWSWLLIWFIRKTFYKIGYCICRLYKPIDCSHHLGHLGEAHCSFLSEVHSSSLKKVVSTKTSSCKQHRFTKSNGQNVGNIGW